MMKMILFRRKIYRRMKLFFFGREGYCGPVWDICAMHIGSLQDKHSGHFPISFPRVVHNRSSYMAERFISAPIYTVNTFICAQMFVLHVFARLN